MSNEEFWLSGFSPPLSPNFSVSFYSKKKSFKKINLDPVSCHHCCSGSLCNVFFVFFSTASRWMCRPRANRVYLWAAQRPYPASMGNISCYKGTKLSSGTCTMQTVPVTPTQNITSAQGCFLLLVKPSHLCGILTGTVWRDLSLSSKGKKSYYIFSCLLTLCLCFVP